MWHYRSPTLFPQSFTNAMKTAATCPDEYVVLAPARSVNDARHIAGEFRRFKWCVLKKNEAPSLTRLMEKFDFRTRIHSDDLGALVYLTAQPNKLSELARLNPHLSEILSTTDADGITY